MKNIEQNIIETKKKSLVDQGRISDVVHISKDILIYYCKSGSRDINLNSEVNDINNDKIVCRHFTFFVLKRNIKNYHKILSTSESISKQKYLYNNDYDKNAHQATTYSILPISENNLGHQLNYFAKFLKKDEKKSFAFWSECHAMAISIHHKSNGSYVIKFYDPNRTTVHLRALCQDINAVNKLTIDNFLSDYEKNLYFPIVKSGVFVFFDEKKGAQVPTVHMQSENLEDNIYYCARYHLNNQINRIIQYCHRDKLVSALSKRAASGTLVLQLAFAESPKVVETYIKSILDSNDLSDDRKVALLDKEIDLEVADRGLFHNLIFLGKLDLANFYIEAIVDSDLAHDRKIELLTAKNTKGCSGLNEVLLEHDAQLLVCYINIILDSSLSNDQKTELLIAKNAHGDSGLYDAILLESLDSIEDYVDAITNSNLSDEQITELLTAKNAHGDSGLCDAILFESLDSVEDYVDIIANSNLSDDQKMELLAAKDVEGNSGLYKILALNGSVQSIEVYISAILDSSLSDDQVTELLAAKDAQGDSGLFNAILLGNVDLVKSYIDAILNSDLSDDQRKELLDIREDVAENGAILGGGADLFNNYQAFDDYFTMCLHSNLSNEVKLELLSIIEVNSAPSLSP